MKINEFFTPDQVDTKLEYHKKLNPLIWDKGDNLKEEITADLLSIADQYIDFIKLDKKFVTDIIFTGSNANYNYTSQSDIDLHIVGDFSTINCTFLEDYLKTKKELWSNSHNIVIYGYGVELYAQDTDDHLVATGVYSVMNSEWLIHPVKQELHINNFTVKVKAAEVMNAIDDLILSPKFNLGRAVEIKEIIKKLRKAGLENGGEFSSENLAFKTVRNNGYLQILSDYITHGNDKSLSLYL